MTIYYDQTESRVGTRLPDSVLQSGHSVIGLEAATGADLLLSTLSAPKLPGKLDPDSRPHQVALGKHLSSGMLIQRKSSRDMTGSIPELSHILQRMIATGCPLCWLLVTGDLACNREGECIIDGKPTGFSYAAVIGSLDYWQLRGGYVTILQRDSLIPSWLNGWLARLADIQREPSKQVIRRTPRQLLVAPDWKSILCSLPGIGPTNAEDIAQCAGTLALSLTLLSDLSNAGMVPGIGKGKIATVRKAMGLLPNQILAMTSPDELEETE